jgi:hypothetical protein
MLGKPLRHPRDLIIVELFSLPILFTARIHVPRVPLHNQGHPRYDYFGNGIYKISLKSTEDVPEDQVNVANGIN